MQIKLFNRKREKKDIVVPPVTELETELKWERYKDHYFSVLRSTIYTLITVSAVAVLIAVLLLPVLQIYGTSMTPTLTEGNIVLSVKTKNFDRGDVVSFYYSNRILVKRVIGLPLDTVYMDEKGDFYLNGSVTPLGEPYLTEKDRGECDLEFPVQVPEGSYFVAGDHRKTSIDSRSSAVGFITEDEIAGKVLFTVWPPAHFGRAK